MTTLIALFEKQADLTQEKLKALDEKVSGLVFDLSTPEGFKAAKETRSECKAITEKVARIAIDTKKEIDGERKSLIEKVETIYSGVITPLEEEEKKRKDEKKKKDDAKKAAEKAIRDQIDDIRAFAQDIYSKTSQEVQDTIEAISTIDVTQFGKLQEEATRVKKETINLLGGALSLIIQNENTPKAQPTKTPEPDVEPEPVIMRETLPGVSSTLLGELWIWFEEKGLSYDDFEEVETIICKYTEMK